MTRALFAVTGSTVWTQKDGSHHPTGYWPEELAVTHEVFTAAGIDITIATPGAVAPIADEAGFAAVFNGDSEEPGRRFRTYLESIADELAHPVDLDTVDAQDYDFVFVPGGHGPMEDLAVSEQFGALLRSFDDAHKPIATVCHGAAALLPARAADGTWLFTGRRLTAFSNVEEQQAGLAAGAPWLLEDRLVAAGAIYEAADAAWAPHTVFDGNLYTGQNPASSRSFAEQVAAAVEQARV